MLIAINYNQGACVRGAVVSLPPLGTRIFLAALGRLQHQQVLRLFLVPRLALQPNSRSSLQDALSEWPGANLLSASFSPQSFFDQVQCLHRENYLVSSEVQNPASATVSWQ